MLPERILKHHSVTSIPLTMTLNHKMRRDTGSSEPSIARQSWGHRKLVGRKRRDSFPEAV